jgi:hypothetical protein
LQPHLTKARNGRKTFATVLRRQATKLNQGTLKNNRYSPKNTRKPLDTQKVFFVIFCNESETNQKNI